MLAWDWDCTLCQGYMYIENHAKHSIVQQGIGDLSPLPGLQHNTTQAFLFGAFCCVGQLRKVAFTPSTVSLSGLPLQTAAVAQKVATCIEAQQKYAFMRVIKVNSQIVLGE